MTNASQDTRVKGTITEAHAADVREVFGAEVAAKLEAAPEGSTFLAVLFNLPASK